VNVKASPIEWIEDSNDVEWYDSRFGFHIIREDQNEPYWACWGEGPQETFESLQEAQEWCQEAIDAWIREFVVVELENTNG
jgi:hypothetical protein